MNNKEIKKILTKQDITITGFVRNFTASHTEIWRLFRSHMESARLKKLIAKELNMNPEEL